MAEILSKSKMELTVTLVLPEGEARALVEITKYGAKAFLRGYYKQLGRSYLEPYESDVKSLFSSIGTQLPPHLRRADNARKVFNGNDW